MTADLLFHFYYFFSNGMFIIISECFSTSHGKKVIWNRMNITSSWIVPLARLSTHIPHLTSPQVMITSFYGSSEIYLHVLFIFILYLTFLDNFCFSYNSYFLILLEFPYSSDHFKCIYETLRLICVTFNSSDSIFIFHLTNAVSELIRPSDRLYFLIELSKLNPDNVNLIIKVINLALHLSKKESCWNFISHIVYQAKIRLQCFEFWKM